MMWYYYFLVSFINIVLINGNLFSNSPQDSSAAGFIWVTMIICLTAHVSSIINLPIWKVCITDKMAWLSRSFDGSTTSITWS